MQLGGQLLHIMGQGLEQTNVILACAIMGQGLEQTNVGASPILACARSQQRSACSTLLSGGRLWTGKAPCLSIGASLFIWMPSVRSRFQGKFLKGLRKNGVEVIYWQAGWQGRRLCFTTRFFVTGGCSSAGVLRGAQKCTPIFV